VGAPSDSTGIRNFWNTWKNIQNSPRNYSVNAQGCVVNYVANWWKKLCFATGSLQTSVPLDWTDFLSLLSNCTPGIGALWVANRIIRGEMGNKTVLCVASAVLIVLIFRIMFKQQLLWAHIPTEGEQVVIARHVPLLNGKELEIQANIINSNMYQWWPEEPG
jgi:hypothetical protein